MTSGSRWSLVAAVLAICGAMLGVFLLTRAAPPVGTAPSGSTDLPSTGTTVPDQPTDTVTSTPTPTPIPPAPQPQSSGRSGFGNRGGGFRGGRSPSPVAIPATPSPAPQPSGITDRFDEVDAALGTLVAGHVAFNTPERMRFSESRTIALIASPQMDATTLSEELRQRIGGTEPIAVAALQIAPLMEAQLEGAPAFKVTPLTPTRQLVSRAAPTEWRWNVTADQTGRQTLHLTINAVVTVDGERFPRSIGVLDRNIDVEITALQQVGLFVQGNWQWLAGTIVIPLGLWFWTNRRRGPRRRK